jgi:hypothetical protein
MKAHANGLGVHLNTVNLIRSEKVGNKFVSPRAFYDAFL